jgi:FKBP-type peptidyl-prolyl cis-trans isomerase FkpA
MKIKSIGLILVLLMTVFACDDDIVASFDFEAQVKIDDDALIEYMNTHYYDADLDSIKEIDSGQQSFFDQVETQTVVEDEREQNLYYIILEQGNGYQPSIVDDVLVTYRGELLSGDIFDERTSIAIGNPWFNLVNLVKGWSYGLSNFKGGTNASMPNEPLEFTDISKGFIFMPSGLGYKNAGQGLIPPNAPLVFKIDLHFASAADHDNDGVSSNDEDIDNDGDVTNDDTDNDFLSNFVDSDDDNDGILTKNEDPNDDGDPTNDDTDGDGIPDYLDSDS